MNNRIKWSDWIIFIYNIFHMTTGDRDIICILYVCVIMQTLDVLRRVHLCVLIYAVINISKLRILTCWYLLQIKDLYPNLSSIELNLNSDIN